LKTIKPLAINIVLTRSVGVLCQGRDIENKYWPYQFNAMASVSGISCAFVASSKIFLYLKT
jgi:hypothetical protein